MRIKKRRSTCLTLMAFSMFLTWVFALRYAMDANTQCCDERDGMLQSEREKESESDTYVNNGGVPAEVALHDRQMHVLPVDKGNRVHPLRGTPRPNPAQPPRRGVSLLATNVTSVLGKAPKECPPELHFAVGLPKTGLFSAPGCGNTWVRHLLQIATGIYTGSVYNDGAIKQRGFLGEGHTDDTVIAVKDHEAFNLDLMHAYRRAILIYRGPHRAVLSEYKRRRAGHTGQVNTKGKLLGDSEVEHILRRWRNTNRNWLLNYTQPLHVVHYDQLKADLVTEFSSVLRFLTWEVTTEQMQCLVGEGEGNFHRQPSESPPPFTAVYTEGILEKMTEATRFVDYCFERRRELGLPMST